MTENEVVEIIYLHIVKNEFPKICPKCGRKYPTVKDYICNTTHIGDPISYDAEEGNWIPKKPIGTIAMVNCSCGTTLSVSSKGMPVRTQIRLLTWLRKESILQRKKTSEILKELRLKVDEFALNIDCCG